MALKKVIWQFFKHGVVCLYPWLISAEKQLSTKSPTGAGNIQVNVSS
jgi:hypothetical protein